jgi:glyoxylase-like metal-dependent hydrolase (beta-lactamase superfamily II)
VIEADDSSILALGQSRLNQKSDDDPGAEQKDTPHNSTHNLLLWDCSLYIRLMSLSMKFVSAMQFVIIRSHPQRRRDMKRGIVLGVLVGVAVLSMAVVAQQGGGAQAPKVVDVEKLKDNLFVLRGANSGGNTAVFITSNGVVVVDAKNPGWGQPILDKIKTLTNKPVTTLINTHTHGDHVSGNVEFPSTVDIIVQENTRTNMAKMIPNSTAADQTVPAQTIFQLNGGKGLPKKTFKDKMKLFSGADEVDLYYFGRGHTNGDAWVLFPALRTVHAGDIFSGKNLPLLDANNGGSAALIADSLEKGYKALNKTADTIITGHSTQMSMADLQEYIAFNRDFMNDVRTAKAAGKSVEDIAASWKMPAKYTGYAAIDANRLKNNVKLAYSELGKSSN